MGLARHAAALAALPALLLALHGCATGERNVAPVPAAREADAIVYGGTSAGVAAAVRLARLGREVVLLSPDVHLGGLSSSGLGWTDTGEKSVIGGLAREFYGRIFEHYARDEAWRWQARDEYGNRGQGTPAIDGAQRTMWIFEPHVAEAVFEALIAESGVQVVRDAWLDRRPGGLEMDAGHIESLRTVDGRRARACSSTRPTREISWPRRACPTGSGARRTTSTGRPGTGSSPMRATTATTSPW